MKNKNNNIRLELDDQKISTSKLMCLLSVALFLSGIILDYFSAPEILSEILVLRLGMCTILIATVALIYINPKFYLKHYSIAISFMFLTGSLTIQAMIFIADPSGIAHSTYFAGLMLIIITVFLGTYISTLLSIVLSMIIISTFLIMSYLVEYKNLALAINNGFFLISALTIGILSNAMKNGFLSQILLLQSSLKESLRDQHLETKRQSELANIDAITNIPNRRYGNSLLEKMIKNAETLDMLVIIYFIDLNGFKAINDTYGHNAGDEVLNIVANRIINSGRKSDVFFRHGGDEFVYAILLEKNNPGFANEFIEGLAETIKPTMVVEGLRLSVSASIGQATYPTNGLSVSNLIHIADSKMYENKAEMKRRKEESIPSLDLSESMNYSKDIVTLSSYKKTK